MGFYKVIEGCYPRVERMYRAWGGGLRDCVFRLN